MLDPNVGRAKIIRDAGALIVDVPAKRSTFATLFLGFWLVMWAVGWLAAFGSLVSGAAGGGSFFVLFWLFLWTLGGILALSSFFWLLLGRERITFDTSSVTISRDISIWSRTTHCAFSDVSNIRFVPHLASGKNNQMTNWYSLKTGTIKIDFGVHTLGFGIELDDAEAKRLITTLTAVFPELK